MPLTYYEAQILKARLQQLTLVETQKAALDRILIEVQQDASAVLAKAAGAAGQIGADALPSLQPELAGIVDTAIDAARDDIVRNISVSARYAVDGRRQAAITLLKDTQPGLARQVPAAFATSRRDAVQAVLARTWDDGKMFSDRIWDLRRYGKNAISETVAKGIAKRQSAYELSKELESYLLMNDSQFKAFKRVWAEKHDAVWKRDWKTRGRLKYNLRRLARTEINNAFREGAVQSAMKAPWVRGVRWNLSGSHPKPDICDDWASDDSYGLGGGVYPPGDTPIDHPNGLCFLTDELVSKAELAGIVSLELAA